MHRKYTDNMKQGKEINTHTHTHKGITEYVLLPGLAHTNVMEKEG